MAAPSEQTLAQVFQAFAGGPRMDGRAFAKCLKEAGLMDTSKFSRAEVDVIFTKCRPRDNRKIDFAIFRQALRMTAKKLEMEECQVLAAVRTASCPRPSQEPAASPGASAARRLFYDRSSYTGTHKHGGPTTIGGGTSEHDVIGDQELVNRSHVVRLRSASPSALQCEEETCERPVTREAVGPQRFFYDKSTYTGTHRNGGPDVAGNGMPKMGYSDLSEVVDREHVLDDALRRRRRASPGAARSRESTPERQQLPTLLGYKGEAPESPGKDVTGAQAPESPGKDATAMAALTLPSSRPSAPNNTPAASEKDIRSEVLRRAPQPAHPEVPLTEISVNGSPVLLQRSNSVHIDVTVGVSSPTITPRTGTSASLMLTSRGPGAQPGMHHLPAQLGGTSGGAHSITLPAGAYVSQVVETAGYPTLLGGPQRPVALSQSYKGVTVCPSSPVAATRPSSPMVLPMRRRSAVAVQAAPAVGLMREKYVTVWTSAAR